MNDILSEYPKVRKVLYIVYAVAGLILSAIAAWGSNPDWLVPAFGVYGVVGTGLGFVAQSNTSTDLTDLTGVTDLTGTGGAPVPEPSED